MRKDLIEALSDTAEKRNQALPKQERFEDPETLFKPLAKEHLGGQPHLQALRQILKDGHIPEPEIWTAAAHEHIRIMREKCSEEVNPFCDSDDEDIIPHLNELGRRLTLPIM